jgi:hypothetical protein
MSHRPFAVATALRAGARNLLEGDGTLGRRRVIDFAGDRLKMVAMPARCNRHFRSAGGQRRSCPF